MQTKSVVAQLVLLSLALVAANALVVPDTANMENVEFAKFPEEAEAEAENLEAMEAMEDTEEADEANEEDEADEAEDADTMETMEDMETMETMETRAGKKKNTTKIDAQTRLALREALSKVIPSALQLKASASGKPVKPGKPGKPGKPEKPEKPETQEKPEKPGKPATEKRAKRVKIAFAAQKGSRTRNCTTKCTDYWTKNVLYMFQVDIASPRGCNCNRLASRKRY